VFTQATLVRLSKLDFAKSKNKEMSCVGLWSGAIQLLECHPSIMDSLLVPLLFFTSPSSAIAYSSATILLLNCTATRPSITSNSSSRFRPVPIRFVPVYDYPHIPMDIIPYCSNNPFPFWLFVPSTFPTNALLLSIDFFSFPLLPFGSFSFHTILTETSNIFPL